MKIKQFAYHGLDAVNPRVAKFYHFVALGTDNVVVLPEAIRFFVLGQVLTELVLAYQVVLYQQVQGIVYGGAADLVVLIFHADVQRFYVEVAAPGVDLFQNGVAFRRFAEAFAFEVGGKNFLYLFKFYCV